MVASEPTGQNRDDRILFVCTLTMACATPVSNSFSGKYAATQVKEGNFKFIVLCDDGTYFLGGGYSVECKYKVEKKVVSIVADSYWFPSLYAEINNEQNLVIDGMVYARTDE